MAGGVHVQLGRETNPWLAPAAAAGCRGKTKALETLLRRPAGGNMQDNGLLHNWMIAIGILAMQADINHSKERHLLPTAFLQQFQPGTEAHKVNVYSLFQINSL